jgi:hypothetical protein
MRCTLRASNRVLLASFGAIMIAAAAPIAGQGQGGQRGAAVPRTVDGQPDLQGVWANNVITPLQRPLELEGRARLTPEEMARLKSRMAELFAGDGDAAFTDGVFLAALSEAKEFKSSDAATGNYNHFWLSERTFDDRTSLITDPPDGRFPALIPAAEARQQAVIARRKTSPADGPEDRSLTERCITFGLPNLIAGYNSNFQIFQSRDYVVLASEMIHDARIIPLDGSPHIGKDIRQVLGDSRGRWEGDTLVIETTNFSPGGSIFLNTSDQLRLTERLTRVSEDTLEYAFTVEDPGTWTRPWSAMIPWTRMDSKIYEYACHEGNIGLTGILSGHRAEEREASAAKGTSE